MKRPRAQSRTRYGKDNESFAKATGLQTMAAIMARLSRLMEVIPNTCPWTKQKKGGVLRGKHTVHRLPDRNTLPRRLIVEPMGVNFQP